MFPKKKHLEALDSLGFTKVQKPDFTHLWKWLNDDLQAHWGLKEHMDPSAWSFWVNREPNMVPRQVNLWDCGFYAIHYGFCFSLQARLTDITKECIALYRKRLILCLLDGLPTLHDGVRW
jgi:Ulp1 family protease